MSNLFLTLAILNYYPSSFNFNEFKFIFSRNKTIYGDEISFISKNKIVQKIKLEQKNINFSIKVIKKDSLIGISNFIIPYNTILLKRIPVYENQCLINMTESSKRILGLDNDNLKINIHCDIEYISNIENNESQKILQVNRSNKINDSIINKHFIYNTIDENNKSKEENNYKNNKVFLEDSPLKSMNKKSNLVYSKPRNFSSKKKSNKYSVKNIFSSDDNDNDSSYSYDTEEELSKKVVFYDEEFSKFVPNLIKEYPLDNLTKMKDVNEMVLFTKNNIIRFLDYQQEYNDKCKKAIDNYDKYFRLLKKYSQKYANKFKQLKVLEKKEKINEIKKSLNRNALVSNLFRIVDIKNNENELYKEIIGENNKIEDDIDIEENLNINENIKVNKKNNLLTDILNNCIYYNQNNNKIIKAVPKILLDNYKLNYHHQNKEIKNEDNILDISLVDSIDNNDNDNNISNKLKYVESNIYDEIDFELDDSLKEFYNNNKNINVIKFKKIHDNNYNYGGIQIIIIEEGDKIKIKDDKGVFTLEKFLKKNSNI
jgi:hypothetical protein